METKLTSRMLCFFKKLDNRQSPKHEIMSVNISSVLFSLSFTHDDLVMQALVWICMVQFRVTLFGVVQFGTSH